MLHASEDSEGYRWVKSLPLIVVLLLGSASVAAQTKSPGGPPSTQKPTLNGAAATPLQARVESYLRKLYAWGPSFRVKVATPKDAPVASFYVVTVEVTYRDQSDSAVVYVSKDGRYLLRGDLQDMNADPLAAVHSRIRLVGNPSKGPTEARVVIVEYADFQCPTCRQLHQALRDLLLRYPQVRLVFKDFPLTQIHPWAMIAATAGRCAYQQNPGAFWKLHDLIFDNQDLISPENAWQKMLDYAQRVGLDTDAFRTCMTSQQASQIVMENLKEGQALQIANTPTLFVNGRRLIGADRALLEQYIQYELATASSPPNNP